MLEIVGQHYASDVVPGFVVVSRKVSVVRPAEPLNPENGGEQQGRHRRPPRVAVSPHGPGTARQTEHARDEVQHMQREGSHGEGRAAAPHEKAKQRQLEDGNARRGGARPQCA